MNRTLVAGDAISGLTTQVGHAQALRLPGRATFVTVLSSLRGIARVTPVV